MRSYDEWLADDSPRRADEEQAGELRRMYSLVEEVYDLAESLPVDAAGFDFKSEVRDLAATVSGLMEQVEDAAAAVGVSVG